MKLQTQTLGTVHLRLWRDSGWGGNVETFCDLTVNGKIHHGTATQNPTDNPSNETGRKVALSRAMGGKYVRSMRNGKPSYHWDYSRSLLSKAERKEIWAAYHGRKKKASVPAAA